MTRLYNELQSKSNASVETQLFQEIDELSSLKAQDLISTTSNAKLEQRHNTHEHSALLVLPPSLCIGTHTHTHSVTLLLILLHTTE